MWFWQRREVYMGPDGPRLAAARSALERAGIEYEYMARGGHNFIGADRVLSGARGAGGGIWYVYVHRRDLAQAEAAVQHALRGL